jgi:hypothetical protein
MTRRLFWETGAESSVNHPDALAPLPIRQMHAVMGRDNTSALGPRSWNVVVVGLDEVGDELTVTLRGDADLPLCRFRLSQGKWEVVDPDK